MFERDYIMRQLQILSQALVRAFIMRAQGQLDKAIKELDKAVEAYTDLESDQFHALAIDQMIALCTLNGRFSVEHGCVLGNVLEEQGDMLLERKKERLADGNYVRALGLYLEALSEPEAAIPVDLHERIAYLIKQTKHVTYPSPIAKRMVAYLTVRNQYADAEDLLFHWLAAYPHDAKDPGWEFFGRLLALSDAQLRQGGLSKREVREGIQAFKDELAAARLPTSP